MKSEEAYSILDIVSESEGQGVVLTRSGSICVSFELREPECYSLTRRISTGGTACSGKPSSFSRTAHMCTNRMCSSRKGTVRTLPAVLSLDQADARHFRGRLYVSHTCVMHFVLSGLKVLRRPTYPRPCPIRENLHKGGPARLDEFPRGS